MRVAKIAISIDAGLLEKLDYFVEQKIFKTRSQAIQVAVGQTIARLEHSRLAEESGKLDKNAEQQLADEGLEEDIDTWGTF